MGEARYIKQGQNSTPQNSSSLYITTEIQEALPDLLSQAGLVHVYRKSTEATTFGVVTVTIALHTPLRIIEKNSPEASKAAWVLNRAHGLVRGNHGQNLEFLVSRSPADGHEIINLILPVALPEDVYPQRPLSDIQAAFRRLAESLAKGEPWLAENMMPMPGGAA